MAPGNVYITGFSAEIQPRQTPVVQAGLCPERYWFVYLTNRRWDRWSYLLQSGLNANFMTEATAKIPIGYTQLWVFEKRFAAHPPDGESLPKERSGHVTLQVQNPDKIERLQYQDRAFFVLREPLTPPAPYHDTISLHLAEVDAIAAAERYAKGEGRRAVVALLRQDIYWH